MSDDAIMNAINKRADLEGRIQKAEEVIKRSKAQILEVNRFIKQWEKYSTRTVEEILANKSLNKKVDLKITSAQYSVQNPKKETVAEMVINILESEGHPLSRTDLFKALENKGVILHGANPEMVLSTMLWRTRDAFGIMRLKSGGYALPDMVESSDEIDAEDDLSDLV